jgi:hypothetical protein
MAASRFVSGLQGTAKGVCCYVCAAGFSKVFTALFFGTFLLTVDQVRTSNSRYCYGYYYCYYLLLLLQFVSLLPHSNNVFMVQAAAMNTP